MTNRTTIIISWLFIILLATLSASAIQPHLIDDTFTVTTYNSSNSTTFQNRIKIEPTWLADGEEEFVTIITANEVIELSKKDEYNQSMFWVENYNKKIVWILLKNESGHLRAYVNDIENLKTHYIVIKDFCGNEPWGTVDNKTTFVSYYSIKSDNFGAHAYI